MPLYSTKLEHCMTATAARFSTVFSAVYSAVFSTVPSNWCRKWLRVYTCLFHEHSFYKHIQAEIMYFLNTMQNTSRTQIFGRFFNFLPFCFWAKILNNIQWFSIEKSYCPNGQLLPCPASLYWPISSFGPDRGRSPVEWGDFPFARTYVRPSVGSPLWAIQPGLRPSQPGLKPVWMAQRGGGRTYGHT